MEKVTVVDLAKYEKIITMMMWGLFYIYWMMIILGESYVR